MLIWGIVFLTLTIIGTYFGLLEGNELERENKSGCLILLSIIITILIITTFL